MLGFRVYPQQRGARGNRFLGARNHPLMHDTSMRRKVIWYFHPKKVLTMEIICDKANFGFLAKRNVPFMTGNVHERIDNVGLIF